MSAMEVKIYTQSITVGFFEVDAKLRLSPAAYWRLLQNAAAAHATLLSAATEVLRLAGQTWMLSKMRLDVQRHPRIGDALTIETWPASRSKGPRAYRDFVLKNDAGEICATASSLWVIVDLATRRPQRIPDSILAFRLDPGYEIPQVDDGALPIPDNPQSEATYRALWSDADQNEHVNNVAMLRWAVDSLPLNFLETHVLTQAEVHYRAEVRVGDTVQLLTETVDTETSGGRIHQVILDASGSPAALVHSRWSDAP